MDKADEPKEKRVLDPKQIHRDTAEVILQEGIDFYVTYNNPGWLRRKGILKKERHFIIKPIVAGTLIRISKIMTDMDFAETIKRDDFISTGIELMAKDAEILIQIIALAITNSEQKPSVSLLKFLRINLTMDEILQIISFVLKQMNVSDFMNSIILIKGMSLLKEGS